MPKDYLSGMVDLTGDAYLNPLQLFWNDNEGSHGRDVSAITSISVHHDAAQRPHDYDSIARYRQEAMSHYRTLGLGLQYHYKIDNTGVIFKIRPHTTWLNCVGSAENPTTLAICLDGYFHPPYNEVPTREQYEALGQLLASLCEEHPEFPATYPDVRPHRDFSSTACPGDLFAPWVLAVQSRADVFNVPANAVYDWPEYQPTARTANPVPTEPAPAPVVPQVPSPPVAPQTTTPQAPLPRVDPLSPLPQSPPEYVEVPAPPVPSNTSENTAKPGFRLPTVDSATYKGIATALQVNIPLWAAYLADPRLAHLVGQYAPWLTPALVFGSGLCAFLMNALRKDVKNY